MPHSMISLIVSSEMRTARPTLTYGMVRRHTQPRRHLTDIPNRSAASGRVLSFAVFISANFSRMLCVALDCFLIPVTLSGIERHAKAHNMSPQRITIPIVVDDLKPLLAGIEPRSLRSYQRDPVKAKFHFTRERHREVGMPINAWLLRDRFLSWPLEDWQRFFEISGEWDVAGSDNHSGDFSRDDFAEWQRFLRAAIVRQGRDWKSLNDWKSPNGEFHWRKNMRLSRPVDFRFEWDSEVPTARIRESNALSLMIATIQVDKLQGASFRPCARQDCMNPPFRVDAHQKIYCSPDCAHLVAVREWRGRKRMKERAAKKQRGKDGKSHGTQKAG